MRLRRFDTRQKDKGPRHADGQAWKVVPFDSGVPARAKIIGSQDLHVKKGSTISLSCVVNVHASSISWYHGSSIVDFDSARGGISLETEKTEGGTSSRLMLTRATLRDSGNYTCVPTGAISASVQVHVLNATATTGAFLGVAACGRKPAGVVLLALATIGTRLQRHPARSDSVLTQSR
uniref:Ig-like domain-containing protein n=1 Tax=Anopheles dirus TaxID=7168 RepID=A0A182NQU2_9DIPT